MNTETLDIRNMDCMELMKEFPDNHFDLAVVDPPYGLGKKLTSGGKSGVWGKRTKSNADKWDILPDDSYFTEVMRVSKNQVVWGANHFKLPPSRCVIAWDKIKDHDKNSSHWEMAWTSFDKIAKIFRYNNNGGFVCKEPKIHPTQKPIKLYDWIFANYAEKGMRILDTHMGSGSIAIASHYAGMHLTACELDEDYYKAACERIDTETRQTTFF